MLLTLGLWLLDKKFQQLCQHDKAFVKALGRRHCVVQFCTKRLGSARFFTFSAGKVTSQPGLHPAPTLTFSFPSTLAAIQLGLTAAQSPNTEAAMLPMINQGKLFIYGDISQLTWFMAISHFLTPASKATPH